MTNRSASTSTLDSCAILKTNATNTITTRRTGCSSTPCTCNICRRELSTKMAHFSASLYPWTRPWMAQMALQTHRSAGPKYRSLRSSNTMNKSLHCPRSSARDKHFADSLSSPRPSSSCLNDEHIIGKHVILLVQVNSKHNIVGLVVLHGGKMEQMKTPSTSARSQCTCTEWMRNEVAVLRRTRSG